VIDPVESMVTVDVPGRIVLFLPIKYDPETVRVDDIILSTYVDPEESREAKSIDFMWQTEEP
jgi:hypothetical protein